MKRNYLWASLLGMAALLTGCSNEEELASQTPSMTYKATVIASKGNIEGLESLDQDTRAIFVGGNTNRFATLWDKGDRVKVYKSGVEVGTLSLDDAANEQYQGTKDAYLSGTLTGSFAAGDEGELYLPSKERSYTGQTGSINSLSANYTFQTTKVKVAEVSGSTITLEKANMTHRQAYLKLRVRDENDKLLHPSLVTISAITDDGNANRIVTSVAADGTVNEYGDIVITPAIDYGEYPSELYVAILNEGYNESKHTHNAVAYRITAIVDGVPYVSDKWERSPAIGSLTAATRKVHIASPEVRIAPVMKLLQGKTVTRKPTVMTGDIDATDRYTFTYSSSDASVAYVNPNTGEVRGINPGTATITATSTAPNTTTTASYTVTVHAPVVPVENVNYVDLGLPSGTLWATMNVGAESETDYGTYFAWGETEGYTSEDEYDRYSVGTSYKWLKEGKFTKYVPESFAANSGYNGFYDNKIFLDPEDDAATANWGSNWHMPTTAQWEEVKATFSDKEHYSWTWCDGTTTQYAGSNVKGWKIVHILTGATLFLPLGGSRWLTTIYNGGDRVAYYWTSELNVGSTEPVGTARALLFSDDQYDSFYFYGSDRKGRWDQVPIRPVVKSSN